MVIDTITYWPVKNVVVYSALEDKNIYFLKIPPITTREASLNLAEKTRRSINLGARERIIKMEICPQLNILILLFEQERVLLGVDLLTHKFLDLQLEKPISGREARLLCFSLA